MALNKQNREILSIIVGDLFAKNGALATLRNEIAAATQSRGERLAAVRNETADPEVREGVAAIDALKAQIATLEAEASVLSEAVDAKVEAILAASGPDADVTDKRREFATKRAEVNALESAFRLTGANVAGAEGVEEFLAENDWTPVTAIRAGATGKGGEGPRRPRFSSVTVDGVEIAKPTLSEAAKYLKSKGAKDVKAGDVLAAYKGEGDVTEGPRSWSFTYSAVGDTTTTVTIATVPAESATEVEDDDNETVED